MIVKWLARVSREAVRLAQPLVPRKSQGVTILTYHLVGAGTSSAVDVPMEVFRTQLSELREIADIWSLDQAITHLQSGIEHSRPAVVITFDDGFDNFRTRAWPLLNALNIPCTFYVPVGFVERTSPIPLSGVRGLKPIEWSALRDLAAEPLLTIGSHSWRHIDLRMMRRHDLRADLRRARARLQECTANAVEHFCYPQAKWSRAVEREVSSVYRTAVVAGGRRNIGTRFNPLRLSRVPVRRDMPVGLSPVVESTVWLEEWAANHVRAFR